MIRISDSVAFFPTMAEKVTFKQIAETLDKRRHSVEEVEGCVLGPGNSVGLDRRERRAWPGLWLAMCSGWFPAGSQTCLQGPADWTVGKAQAALETSAGFPSEGRNQARN